MPLVASSGRRPASAARSVWARTSCRRTAHSHAAPRATARSLPEGHPMHATPNLERSLRYLLAWAPAVEAAKTTLARRAVPDAALHAGTLGFQARTTLGELVGATTRVTGAILGARDYTTVRGWVEAPLATISTGRRWIDRALRAALDVERHPTMHFTLRGATVV